VHNAVHIKGVKIKVHQENEWVKFDIFTGAAAYR
jgi:hypothetical protein